MTNLLQNIDDVRARIMELENAKVFDALAWGRVLADLETAERVSALADAKRRMETAQTYQLSVDEMAFVESVPVDYAEMAKLFGHRPVFIGMDLASDDDYSPDVAIETEGV